MITRLSRPWQIDLLGIGASVALTAVVYAMVVVPRASTARACAQQQFQLDDWADRTAELAHVAANLDLRINQAQRRISSSSFTLESAHALNDRINMINMIAANEHLAVNTIDVRTPVESDDNLTFPIEVAGTGQFGDLITFFNRLDTEMAATGVVAFRVSQGTSEMAFVLDLAWHANRTPESQFAHVE